MGYLRDLLDRVVVYAGFPKGRIRARMLRVTCATAWPQTLDRGAPIARWTVEREWGTGRGGCSSRCTGDSARSATAPKWWSTPFSQYFARGVDRIVTRAGEEVSAP